MDAAAGKKLHIAMFPWLAFGHMIPYFELAKHIAQKGHYISFIATPRNIQRLPKIPPNLSSSMNFVTVTLPHEENLPQDAEATMDVPFHLIWYLKIASDGLQDPITEFLETSTPDWIIYDFFPHWLPPIASKLRISRAFFSIFNASSVSQFGSSMPEITGIDDSRTKPEHFTVPPEWVTFPTNVKLRQYEANQIFSNRVNYAPSPQVSDQFRIMSVISGSEVYLIRSCMELEPEWLKLLGDLHLKPIVPVGLIPPSLREEEQEDGTCQKITEWLDKQEKGSVVYVAFGSEVTPTQADFTELAHGLELSGMPFFWVLRNRHGSGGSGNSVELPDGFEERVKDRGVVWRSWAPQLKILGHDSVGGFLTHGGWSSIVEAISFGRPLIMLPIVGDQWINARLLEEKKLAMEIPRNEQDGSLARNSVADSLNLVMLKQEGNIYKENVKEMSKIFGDKDLHLRYIDEMVEYLQNHRKKLC